MATSENDRAAPQPGEVEVDGDADPTVVWLWGEHDLTTVGSVAAALREASAGSHADVVVDLSEVTFMDASTLGAIVHSRQLLEARRRSLRLRSPHTSQRRLLEICHLADLIDAEQSAPALHEQRARSALETWVEVPSTGRPAASAAAMSANPARGDPEDSPLRRGSLNGVDGRDQPGRDGARPAGSSVHDG